MYVYSSAHSDSCHHVTFAWVIVITEGFNAHSGYPELADFGNGKVIILL